MTGKAIIITGLLVFVAIASLILYVGYQRQKKLTRFEGEK